MYPTGLEVAMHDAGRVGLGDPLGGLGEVAEQRPEIRLLVVDSLVEGVARDQLHRDVVDRFGGRFGVSARPAGPDLVVADLVDGDDVRVVQGGGRPGLGDEAAHPLLVADQLRRQDLERDAPLELLVLRDVDLAHAAGAERADDAVMGDAILRFQCATHCALPCDDRGKGGNSIRHGGAVHRRGDGLRSVLIYIGIYHVPPARDPGP